MILAQIIRYTNAEALEATWVNEAGQVVKCQAYASSQMHMLAADLGNDAPAYQALMDEVAATYVAQPPEPPTVPHSVTRAQAIAALILSGKRAQVQQVIDSIPETVQRELAQNDWDNRLTFERDNARLVAIAAALSIDLDEMFILAGQQ